MVLLYQITQVFRRAQLRVRGQRAIGFQLAHRTVRCGVAVQRDCPRAALLAFDRFTKERLGGPATSRLGLSLKSTAFPPRPEHAQRLTWLTKVLKPGECKVIKVYPIDEPPIKAHPPTSTMRLRVVLWVCWRPCCTDRSLGGEDWTVYQGPVSDHSGQLPCHSKPTKTAVITSRSSGTE